MKLNRCNQLISFIWITFHYHVSCYNQIVKLGFTWANSSSVGYGGYPIKTVDGDLRQNDYTYCMHTAPGYREAWLRIDLRKIFNIHSVKFWYRNDSFKGPVYNTRRIHGNTTQTFPPNICYQDDGKTTLPPIIEQQCKGVAQYVWIYTNKTFVDGAFLEICEVQIYGCSYQGIDGNCISCDQCKNDCNIHGECDGQGCKSENVPPPFCKECPNGVYGEGCQEQYGNCESDRSCHHINGSCPGLCEPGYLGERCQNG